MKLKHLSVLMVLVITTLTFCSCKLKTKDEKCNNTSVTDSPEVVETPDIDNTSGYTRLSFDESELATEMLEIYCYSEKDRKSGLIDTNGKVVCPAIYDFAYDSSEGYSIVCIDTDNSSKKYYDPLGNLLDKTKNIYTFVNIKGEECFGYFSNAQKFSEGVAFVEDAKELLYALNISGELTKLDNIRWINEFSEGMAMFGSEKDNNVGFINHDFQVVIPAVYSSAQDFSEGLAAIATSDGSLAYIDKEGNTVLTLDCDYNEISWATMRYFASGYNSFSFSEGLAFLNKKGNCSYIDKSGNVIIEGICGSKFVHGLAPAMDENGNSGYINKNGEFVIPATYSKVSPFNEYGVAMVYNYGETEDSQGNYYPEYCGYINTKGEVVIPIEYYCSDYMFGYPEEANGIIKLYKDGYKYFFKANGEVVGKMVESVN